MSKRKHRIQSTVVGADTAAQAARNALVLLKKHTFPQGIDDLPHFDHKGFLDDVEQLSLQTTGKKLTAQELRTLAQLVATYCKRTGVVS
jgi:hypothetical protein